MGALLDTSAYSAMKRGHSEILQVLRETEEIYINPVALGEVLSGFRRTQHRRKNEAELMEFLDSPHVIAVPIDQATALHYVAIVETLRQAGTPIPSNDVWIAASAAQHGATLITLDGHFLKVPQVIVRCFDTV